MYVVDTMAEAYEHRCCIGKERMTTHGRSFLEICQMGGKNFRLELVLFLYYTVGTPKFEFHGMCKVGLSDFASYC